MSVIRMTRKVSMSVGNNYHTSVTRVPTCLYCLYCLHCSGTPGRGGGGSRGGSRGVTPQPPGGNSLSDMDTMFDDVVQYLKKALEMNFFNHLNSGQATPEATLPRSPRPPPPCQRQHQLLHPSTHGRPNCRGPKLR